MKNIELLNSDLNKTFEDVLWMTKEEFRQWCIDFRKLVVYLWDAKGIPPKVGYDKNEIIDAFNKMSSYPVHKFLVKDENTQECDVIRNTSNFSGYVNDWFPTMMKTRINYTKDVDSGKSIYDFFARDELLDTFVLYSSRHFKRDSFYAYSTPVKVNDVTFYGKLPVSDNSVEWIKEFESKFRKLGKYDYWLSPVKDGKEYTGFNEKLKNVKQLSLTRQEIESLSDIIPDKCKTNVDWEKSETYQIRYFEFGNKLFPTGFKAFRVSYCQAPVNFPPMTAKLLYEKFTNDIKKQDRIVIYDPSAGWGGRLIGAMSVSDDRKIHYIGTDPNTDHTLESGRTKYHDLADFFNKNTYRGSGFLSEPNTYEIYQLGSEEIHKNKDFKKHKGKVDLIFTSPPYFSKEAYSENEEQSYKKFSEYESWREGFLKRTLQTCYEWLRDERYLLFNIADIEISGKNLPLEQDTIDICKSLGFEYRGFLKMALAQAPGANRTTSDEDVVEEEYQTVFGKQSKKRTVLKGKMKNFCIVNGLLLKYEPIFIFYKSLKNK